MVTRTPSEVFHDIKKAFTDAMGQLGAVVSEKFMYTVALQTIDCFYRPEIRARQHLLLMWRPGWSKSYTIRTFYNLLGEDLAAMVADVNFATLCGSADEGIFLPPLVLEKRFLLVSEFASTLRDTDEDVKNALLSLLEEGEYERRLVKFAKVKKVDKHYTTEVGEGHWINKTTFRYRTYFSLICATYPGSSKYFLDQAMLSRFQVVDVSPYLTEELAAEMQPIQIPDDLIQDFRYYLRNPPKIDLDVHLDPSSLKFLKGLSPREKFTVLRPFVLARRFWGLQTTFADLVMLHKEFVHQTFNSSSEDKILHLLSEQPMTARELAKHLGISHTKVYQILGRYPNLFASRRVGRKSVWFVRGEQIW